MHCKKMFYQTKVVTNQNLQLLCYVTFFDILHHYGVVAASQICSVSRKYCAVLQNRFFLVAEHLFMMLCTIFVVLRTNLLP